MQLSDTSKGRIGATLCLMTANLFAATGVHAQVTSDSTNNPSAPDAAQVQNAYDQPASEPGTTTIDSAILFYKENGGRVQAIEPMISFVQNDEDGDVYSARLTYDSLTGATPNGAAPWKTTQTFVKPAYVTGEGHTTTRASGGVTVTNPVTGATEVQYTAAPYALPLDTGFHDRRWAVDLGYAHQLSSRTKINFGVNGSHEQDYQSYSGRFGIAQDFNQKTTTVSLGVNYEHDISKPFYGTPTPLTWMSGAMKDGSRSKNVLSLVAGVTQVVTRNWLVQLNYSYGHVSGYQTDPYKLISVVNPVTGAPYSYMYESRPESRTRHAVYLGSKMALGSFVTSISGRYYHDSWGIDSITGELSEHIPVGERAYLEPGVRYYHQSAADFFAYYLPWNIVKPQYASADSRLDSFNAITLSLSGGYKLTDQVEFYGMVQSYRQSKAGTKGTLPGQDSSLKLFAGPNAVSVLTGFKFKF
ncbi:DUF3570 domain-containing protein [Kordiimonas marina]|uniref:DUF3570 domain-containing protein n=1 Tax=Kordiimonas marina TaxID=2872312 RepID=UPI001FF6211B|nr:DUF3570 domain-containing protein [Kordiimonas marina]MCJ9430091.1 DUF3570 domain-containing protein [Kordiimonas marina]